MTADREHRTITVERMRWWRNPDVLLPIIAAATVLSLAGLVAISLQVAAVLRAQSQAAQDSAELAAATSECVLRFLLIPVEERYLVPEEELRDLCEVDPGPRPDTSVPPGGFATAEPEEGTPDPTATPTPTPTATVSLFGPPAIVTQPPRPPAPGPAPQPIAPAPAPQPPPQPPDRPGQRPPHAGQGRPDQPPGRDR